ncbi:MAG TPA: glycosyltransferase family A protein [Phycicoccus sp.]|nr:glycosyltransferase family A protein [Phycicoccus sp.]
MTQASLIIPSRGGRDRLPRLFAALEQQTHRDLEVVVVIDGDADDSESLARSWARHIPLTTIVLPDNRGRSVALNTGFGAAEGQVLIRCDDDLEPGPDHVARHVAHHDGDQVGVIGLCPNVLADTAYTRAYGRRREQLFRSQAFALPAQQRWRLWGANVSVRRDTWRDIGGYDTAYRAYGFEDVDWGYRLHRAGIPLILDPELDARHHGAVTTTRDRALRAYHSGAARHTFEQIHGTGAIGPLGQPAGVWGRAIFLAGRQLGKSGIDKLGRTVDRLADSLPRPVAEKAVAFTVEAAAEAGRRHPDEIDVSI